MQHTPNLNLKKPEATDYVNIEDLNENADTLDEAIGNLETTVVVHSADELQHIDFPDRTNLDVNSKPSAFPRGYSFYRETRTTQMSGWRTAIGAPTGVSLRFLIETFRSDEDGTYEMHRQRVTYFTSTATESKIVMVSERIGGQNDTWGDFYKVLTQEDYDELFQFANDGKTNIANAVSAMGVPANPADTFSQLATKIGQIYTGKKVATGQTGSSSTPIVTGLDFRPSFVFVWQVTGGSLLRMSFAMLQNIGKPFGVYVNSSSAWYELFGFKNASGTYSQTAFPGTITNDGFSLNNFITDGRSTSYHWIAVE